MKKQLLLILCLGCSLSFSTVYAQNNNGDNQPAAQTGQQAAAKADTPKPAKSHLHLTKNSIDFGTIPIGKTKVVEAHAAIDYFSKRHEKEYERYWQ